MNTTADRHPSGDEQRRRSEYNRRMPQAPQTPPAKIVPKPIRKGIDVSINGKHFRHTGDPAMPLLWYLRDVLRLTGCKYGCDDKSCGACSVLVDGKLERACAVAMADLADTNITTIEGLAGADGALHPVQLLPVRPDHGRGRPAVAQTETVRRRHRRHRQPVSLRQLSAHPPCDPA